jgi:hypothetical protein
MVTRNLKISIIGFSALALAVLANGTAFAQAVPGGIPPGGVPTTTNGQAPPPGTLPSTFGGGSGWGTPVVNPDGSIDQPFVQVNADGSQDVTWAHTAPPPPPPAPTPEPDRTQAPPAAPASTNSGDRDVGGGMKERAGTGTNPVDRDVGGGMKERAGTGTDPVDREVGGGMKAKGKEAVDILSPKSNKKLVALEAPKSTELKTIDLRNVEVKKLSLDVPTHQSTAKLVTPEVTKARTLTTPRVTVATTVSHLTISHPVVSAPRLTVNVPRPTINVPRPAINIPVMVRR